MLEVNLDKRGKSDLVDTTVKTWLNPEDDETTFHFDLEDENSLPIFNPNHLGELTSLPHMKI